MLRWPLMMMLMISLLEYMFSMRPKAHYLSPLLNVCLMPSSIAPIPASTMEATLKMLGGKVKENGWFKRFLYVGKGCSLPGVTDRPQITVHYLSLHFDHHGTSDPLSYKGSRNKHCTKCDDEGHAYVQSTRFKVFLFLLLLLPVLLSSSAKESPSLADDQKSRKSRWTTQDINVNKEEFDEERLDSVYRKCQDLMDHLDLDQNHSHDAGNNAPNSKSEEGHSNPGSPILSNQAAPKHEISSPSDSSPLGDSSLQSFDFWVNHMSTGMALGICPDEPLDNLLLPGMDTHSSSSTPSTTESLFNNLLDRLSRTTLDSEKLKEEEDELMGIRASKTPNRRNPPRKQQNISYIAASNMEENGNVLANMTEVLSLSEVLQRGQEESRQNANDGMHKGGMESHNQSMNKASITLAGTTEMN
ncbi:hypothetical protein OG21DRAFT_1526397 [Imleria badia]|nr:hypothetical protein OG21DRAFT_1526397 [Imleria badia]